MKKNLFIGFSVLVIPIVIFYVVTTPFGLKTLVKDGPSVIVKNNDVN